MTHGTFQLSMTYMQTFIVDSKVGGVGRKEAPFLPQPGPSLAQNGPALSHAPGQ